MFKFLRRNRKTILRLAFYFPLTVLAAVKSKDYFKRDKLLDTVCFFFFNLSPIYPHIHTHFFFKQTFFANFRSSIKSSSPLESSNIAYKKDTNIINIYKFKLK